MDYCFLLNKYLDSVISVIGPLLGVALGWLLERSSRWGRVKVFKKNIVFSPMIRSASGGHTIVNFEEATSAHITIKIELYNTSSFTKKIWRDIWLCSTPNTQLIFSRPKLFRHRNFNDKPFITINPGEIKEEFLVTGLDDHIKAIPTSDFYLQYRNQNNKLRKIKLDIVNQDNL